MNFLYHFLPAVFGHCQYRPTKIPLNSVRPFEYSEVVLKDEADIDPNDQTSVLEHLDNVVRNLIEKSSGKAVSRSELALPLIRIKVDYSGFMTINPQRFGQKYVGKVANPQDILIFSKAAKKRQPHEGKIDDSERLRPEELNQQNIEALVAESNLKMEILPVNDLDVALHDFVNKDDKMAFYDCLKYNLEETRNKISQEPDTLKFEEEDLILKVGECMQARVKERSMRSKDGTQFTPFSESLRDTRGKGTSGLGSFNSFSDDEDTALMLSSSKSTARGRKASSVASRSSQDASGVGKAGTSTRGRGRGRGRGSINLKQTTLDASLNIRRSGRTASVAASTAVRSIENDEDEPDSPSSDEVEEFGINEVLDSSENEDLPAKGRKRAAPTPTPTPRGRGRGKGATSSSKRGRKPDTSSIHKTILTNDDDDDDDDDDMANRMKKAQPRVTRNYGALRR